MIELKYISIKNRGYNGITEKTILNLLGVTSLRHKAPTNQLTLSITIS